MSGYLTKMKEKGFEELILFNDPKTGLNGAIAIHSTARGPALGGTRVWAYPTEESAISDVMYLACGMSYKAAAAELPLGGGKAVIIEDEGLKKNESLFKSYGRFVEQLKGRFITAADMGIGEIELDWIRQETSYVVGGKQVGSPSPVTAYGVWKGIKACAEEVYGTPHLKGKVVAVQGAGSVGAALCEHLASEGALLLVSDLDQNRVQQMVQKYGATPVDPKQIVAQKCDIFSPCGIGGVINKQSIADLKCAIIAGAANNVIKEEGLGTILKEQGILYAPDYIINAGGLIFVEMNRQGKPDIKAIKAQADRIEQRLKEIFKRARILNLSPEEVADIIAEEKMGRR